MGEIINGKKIAKELGGSLKTEVDGLIKEGVHPKLTVLLVGEDPASNVYVRNKERSAKRVGILSAVERYPENLPQEDLLKRITELNSDKANHGILVQLPLPGNFDEEKTLLSIDPEKDVDGFHPINIGRLVAGQKCIAPCTPSGIIHLIESCGRDITGLNAVVVGRSNIVGKPASAMLLKKNATVTVCHSKTVDLPSVVSSADILVAAIGSPEFIKGDWVKPGSIVIDVGMNRKEDGSLVGDVEFDLAKDKAAFITPVPGGVGPMTIAMLLRNTVTAAKRQNNI